MEIRQRRERGGKSKSESLRHPVIEGPSTCQQKKIGRMRRQSIMLQSTPLLLLLGLLLQPSFPASSTMTVAAFSIKTKILTQIMQQQRLPQPPPVSLSSSFSLRRALTLKMMATNKSSSLDPVTYLRTEWVSAALVANQTPRVADRVLQLGVSDGRIVNFVPRTVREIITSSAERKDGPEAGGLTISAERQLKQMVCGGYKLHCPLSCFTETSSTN